MHSVIQKNMLLYIIFVNIFSYYRVLKRNVKKIMIRLKLHKKHFIQLIRATQELLNWMNLKNVLIKYNNI